MIRGQSGKWVEASSKPNSKELLSRYGCWFSLDNVKKTFLFVYVDNTYDNNGMSNVYLVDSNSNLFQVDWRQKVKFVELDEVQITEQEFECLRRLMEVERLKSIMFWQPKFTDEIYKRLATEVHRYMQGPNH